jgi:NitT/TauT family transport system substrate-binding protein
VSPQYTRKFNRRRFLGAVTLVGTAGLLGLHPTPAAAEPPPETTRLRLSKVPSVCVAPQYVAEEFLRMEGFTDVQYVGEKGAGVGGLPLAQAMGAGEVDVAMNFVAPLVVSIDAGDPVVLLGGVHVGCFELFGTERVRTIKDLKGKSVAVLQRNSAQHIFLASIVTQVGLDPNRDLTWLEHPPAEAKQLLAEGKIDGFLGFPPDPQDLRARKIGQVLINSAVDRPWSQYFCCLVSANREFVRRHPVATKRALRAILKSDQLCAVEPGRGAQAFMDRGFTGAPEYVRQAMTEIPFGRWREYEPEDTVRFYALRLHEAGMIKSSPQKILAQGTDWRFLTELKKELKG